MPVTINGQEFMVVANAGSVWRSFIIDADQTVAGIQAIESGRYIFETKFSAADIWILEDANP